jgi:hypothetical protein
MTPAESIRRLKKQKGLRSNVEWLWDQIERYIMPLSAGSFYVSQDELSKDWATKHVWDSTAPIGAQRLASMFYASMYNPAAPWFSIGFRNPLINKDKEAKFWIETVTRLMYEAIAASNFGLEMASGIYSEVGFGNTFITLEPVNPKIWEGLDFAAVPLRETYFEPDWKGRPRVGWRTYSWTAGQICSKFDKPGEEGAAAEKLVPAHIDKAAEEGSEELHEVAFCIFPRDDAKPMAVGEKMRAVKDRPFGGMYVLVESKELLGEELGYYEMPMFLGRWDKAVGSQWGFGPGALALPTVKLVNVWLEAITDAAEKVVDPATLVTERGLMSDLNLRKGGKTVVRSLEDIGPYESKARFDVSEMMLSDMRNMIRKYFREDDITLKDSPAMTATEAQIRVELLNRLFGSTVGRHHSDLSSPILQAVFNMMYRADRFPAPPEIILKTNPAMQITYLGPFMRSQRTDEVAAIERLGSTVAALKKMGFDDAADAFDAAGAVREMAERLATPAQCLRSVEESKSLATTRAKLQQAASVAQINKTDAEGARAAAGAMEMANGTSENA